VTSADNLRSSLPFCPVFRVGFGRRLPKGYNRVGAAGALPGVLRDFGIDAESLFRAQGLPEDIFSDPDNAIPFASFCSLLARCAREANRDDLGLLIGEKVSASSLGLVGFLLQQEPDVRSALNVLVRYLHHSDGGAVPNLTESADQVSLGYSIYEQDVEACEHMYDGALAIGANIMRKLCGPQWTPTEVLLSRRPPFDPRRYERFFGAPVRFNTEHSVILFASSWLDVETPNADDALRRVLQEQVDLLEREEPRVSEQVRRLLRTLLCTRSPSIEEISALMRMTRRTLARRLEAEGTTFKELSDSVHFEIARQLIRNTALSLTRISLALNYSEPSAFTRAFRKWSGMSPGEWRESHATG
jgi:AraC-like DNA-binding protein